MLVIPDTVPSFVTVKPNVIFPYLVQVKRQFLDVFGRVMDGDSMFDLLAYYVEERGGRRCKKRGVLGNAFRCSGGGFN